MTTAIKSAMRRKRWIASNKVYLVDATNGSDTNSGMTESSALQTITAVNALPLKPGDRVLLKRGETFAGKLNPLVSGKANKRITYSYYGSAENRPIIDGSAEQALEIDAYDVRYLKYIGIDFAGATGASVSTVQCYADNMYFYDCIMRDSANYIGFSAYSTTGAEIHDILLENCTLTGNYTSGLFIGSADGTFGPYEVYVKNCTSHTNGHSTSADHGFYIMFGVTLDGCTAYSNSSSGLKVNCQTNPGRLFKPKVKNCTSYSNAVGIYVGADYATIFNNLVYSNTGYNLQFDTDGDNCTFYYNTFVNGTNASSRTIAFASATGCTGNTFKNNIFCQDRAVVAKGILHTSAGTLENLSTNNTFDYNVYYLNGNAASTDFAWDGGGSTTASYNTWKATSAAPDVHSSFLANVPDFATRYTNMHAAAAGNLLSTGVAITGYDVDKDGGARGATPTAGCYEDAS